MPDEILKNKYPLAFAFAEQILPGSGIFDLSVGPSFCLKCSSTRLRAVDFSSEILQPIGKVQIIQIAKMRRK